MRIVKLDDVEHATEFCVNENADLELMRNATLPLDNVIQAVAKSHATIRQFTQFDVDVFALLGMRNLSAFIGEIFASQMVKVSGGLFRANPHQDGYPDLLLMDEQGDNQWQSLLDRLRDKNPFSPFPTGGIEVKATCGSVPTPAWCAARGLTKPHIGDQRIKLMRSYDWKAHHQQTNHLIGLFWDFVEGVPHIVGVFYSRYLNESDWGAIIQPREGGGRTTSVSIMTRLGVRKMCEGWIMVRNDPDYLNFFSKYNGNYTFS